MVVRMGVAGVGDLFARTNKHVEGGGADGRSGAAFVVPGLSASTGNPAEPGGARTQRALPAHSDEVRRLVMEPAQFDGHPAGPGDRCGLQHFYAARVAPFSW